jgi:secreted PhoX family phosphatase
MGRFNHEAACVDPASGAVYLTEDRDDGLLYCYVPRMPGRLAEGGTLHAAAVEGIADSRNWNGVSFAPQSWHGVRWIELDNVEAADDDLRKRGAAAGATLFARGEGIHMGEGELYFCCTSGGVAKLGQVFRLVPPANGQDKLQLFYESTDIAEFNFGDNLTVAPNGHLIVCEDAYTDEVTNYLRGITPAGVAYPLALARTQTEWAGACFSPDGRTLFVNLYRPAKTVAITGPWIA